MGRCFFVLSQAKRAAIGNASTYFIMSRLEPVQSQKGFKGKLVGRAVRAPYCFASPPLGSSYVNNSVFF